MTREAWQRRLGPLYGGAVALVHTTPWRWPSDVSDDEARSPAWLVALGVPVGLAAWLVASLLEAAGIALPIAALAGLATLSFASAALGERGVVEAIDGWQGSARASVTSALVLVFAILIRAAAVLVIAPTNWLVVLVATAVVGRWAAVFLQAIGDPVAPDDRVRSLVAAPAPAWWTAVLAVGAGGLAMVALGGLGLAALAVVAVAVFVLGLVTQQRDGGLTPAVVGAAAAIGELVVLVFGTIR